MRLFVTGFGPFLEVAENPSAVLARGSGHPFEILEVAFQAVDEWIAAMDPITFDAWLMLGVSGSAKTSRLEIVAHNRIGRTPDARKEVWGGRAHSARPPCSTGFNPLAATRVLG